MAHPLTVARLSALLRTSLRRGPLHPRWRHAVAVGAIVGLVTAPLPGGGTVGAAVASLGQEWTACLVHGRPPEPAWHALPTHPTPPEPDRPLPQPSADGVPVLVPRLQMPGATPASQASSDKLASRRRSVRVAVIDSGVQAGHPDVTAVRPGLDLVNPCGDGQQDVTGHGTMVAGVISSVSYGAAPRVDVLPVRISMYNGRHLPWVSAAAVVYATHSGADVINMSYANQHRPASLVERAAMRYAARRGVALVAAAGNDPGRRAGYPAAYPETLSVTSVDADGDLSRFAARRGVIDIAAPGSRVLTLWPDGSARVASGTSMAAPVVSAAITKLLLADPSLSGAEAVRLLRESASPRRLSERAAQFGVLDVRGALRTWCRTVDGCQDQPRPIADGATPESPRES